MSRTLLAGLLLFGTLLVGCNKPSPAVDAIEHKQEPVITFGLVTDIQYADREPVKDYDSYYRCSIPKLRECVNYFNSQDLDFVIQLGDFVDCYYESFDVVFEQWNKIKTEKYMLMGNHDYLDASISKEAAYNKMGLEKPYYSFTKDGYTFVVLETFDIAVLSNPKGSPERMEAEKVLEGLKAKKAPNAFPWNSGICKEQLAWLDATLGQAEREGKKVIVFGHHPVMPLGGPGTLWNGDEVAALLEKYPCVKAYFNGHLHEGRHHQNNGVQYITFESMLSKPADTGYAKVSLYPDKIVIEGFGNVTNYELNFTPTVQAAAEK